MLFDEKISVAPMMDVTDRHFRYFMRLITKKATLYTEMVHTNQIIYGGTERFLAYKVEEQPLVLQLGGSEPTALAQCAKLAEQIGYSAINLNVGCPSERVQKGSFGACLMKQKNLVAECISAMQAAVKIPVTVKTRLGVDELDNECFFFDFIETLAIVGCKNFIIHARKAWLKGLNPKQNRSIPPLNYERVYRLKQLFPQLYIVINGGIKTIVDMQQHLQFVDGIMLGREAQNNPFLLAQIDEIFFAGDVVSKNIDMPIDVLKNYLPYVKIQLEQGIKLNLLIRPILGLFHGLPGARTWRGFLTTESNKQGLGVGLLERSLELIS